MLKEYNLQISFKSTQIFRNFGQSFHIYRFASQLKPSEHSLMSLFLPVNGQHNTMTHNEKVLWAFECSRFVQDFDKQIQVLLMDYSRTKIKVSNAKSKMAIGTFTAHA